MNRQTAARWAGYVAVAVVFAIACGFLSHWQFSRNAERNAQLALVSDNYDAPAVPFSELIPIDSDLAPGDEWRPVTLTGEYLTEEQTLVRNRVHGGTAAFEVLVPLVTDDGRVVIVDRGWLPPGDEQPLPDEIPAAPSGEVTVVARVKPGEPLPTSGRSAPAGQVPTIHLPLLADSITGGAADGAVIEQSAYAIMVSEDPAPASRPQALESPSADPGPYLSYAIQWILFAIMGFVFIWYMIRTERKHRREDAEDAAAAAQDATSGTVPAKATPPRARTRHRRKRDRDMETEDDLVDSQITPR